MGDCKPQLPLRLRDTPLGKAILSDASREELTQQAFKYFNDGGNFSLRDPETGDLVKLE